MMTSGIELVYQEVPLRVRCPLRGCKFTATGTEEREVGVDALAAHLYGEHPAAWGPPGATLAIIGRGDMMRQKS